MERNEDKDNQPVLGNLNWPREFKVNKKLM